MRRATISENAREADALPIKNVAFGMKEGELSTAVQCTFGGKSGSYVVYLERMIPAEDVKLADVREKLIRDVAGVKEQAWMSAKLMVLRRSSRIDIKDRILSEQYEAMIKSNPGGAKPQ